MEERRKKILINLVKDYIEFGEPISSQTFKERHKIDLSSATIRIEFQKLTRDGYLSQPYFSAGRVPTDKAYRFFVDYLIEKSWIKKDNEELFNLFENFLVNDLKLLQSLTKFLAKRAHSLVLVYLKEKDIILKEGWEEVLKEKELIEKNLLGRFCDFLKRFEDEIKNLVSSSEIKVFIGKENPVSCGKDFSSIISKVYLPKEKETIFSILGPKRMDYFKNINLLISLRNCVEKI
jgi:transcriptional regulator of heat shock response